MTYKPYDCERCKWDCYPYCICPELRAAQVKVLQQVIDIAELTFRSDVINPVRDVVEPMLALLQQTEVSE